MANVVTKQTVATYNIEGLTEVEMLYIRAALNYRLSAVHLNLECEASTKALVLIIKEGLKDNG